MKRNWLKIIEKEAKTYQNPQVSPDISYVWVLSGHSTVNLTSHAFPNLYPKLPENRIFRNEDKIRIEKAIELIKQISKNNNSSPLLIYNGTKVQNQALRDELEKRKLDIEEEKVIISEISEDLDPKKANSFTQFIKFPEEILKKAETRQKYIAILTHRYQLPKTTRYPLSSNVLSAQPLWRRVKILFFVADEEFDPDSPDFKKTLEDEAQNMQDYVEKGDISKLPYSPRLSHQIRELVFSASSKIQRAGK